MYLGQMEQVVGFSDPLSAEAVVADSRHEDCEVKEGSTNEGIDLLSDASIGCANDGMVRKSGDEAVGTPPAEEVWRSAAAGCVVDIVDDRADWDPLQRCDCGWEHGQRGHGCGLISARNSVIWE